ncbi:hypothetical protein CANCADRAFT_31751 [Tortispora caseinolytica NRRL Y-17796]|uniref:BZIP domain-containing protein n=1 Tax=Tortispora caseinolytica NRRL Y-17796 TaxID=767744 RepID=A0A1E4TGP1_9ASCO|nr:hypothetical protein CANCADRAFT_31751 [Tortispora caseinolytica NRRL Y-17796]
MLPPLEPETLFVNEESFSGSSFDPKSIMTETFIGHRFFKTDDLSPSVTVSPAMLSTPLMDSNPGSSLLSSAGLSSFNSPTADMAFDTPIVDPSPLEPMEMWQSLFPEWSESSEPKQDKDDVTSEVADRRCKSTSDLQDVYDKPGELESPERTEYLEGVKRESTEDLIDSSVCAKPRALPKRRRVTCGDVSYQVRPRQEPLPPIFISDPKDSAAVRRARNTEAARKSRARKANLITSLQERVKELEARNAALEQELQILRKA